MKKFLTAAVAVSALLVAGAASAEGAVSYNIAVTSDYVFRGITQTDESPAIQGGIDYTNGIFYAGTWASNVDFGTKADYEVDLYAGIKPTAGKASFDFGVLYYAYPQEDDLNVTELKAAVSYPLGAGSIGATYYTNTDDTFDTYYAEVNAAYPITEKVSLSGAIGTQKFAFGGEYDTWNVGGSVALTDKFSVDLRYHDTSESIKGMDERFVVTLKAAF
ncbi:TorF family putative porin [Asticcacaulis sp. BYS171W]|uniref:TorF family putative porin n=1 Tax=Asticcacaulis aquaticus TaxID=2984212 RepID=A0ABT5HQI9_9CAUL|nr:TorF family putative porin [Asticcacaulis aquaticus]MDC7681726.1 TorF family putative porin [Asticcacaulis aquaticus]